MIYEDEIEKAIADFLKGEIKDYPIEVLSTDYLDMVQKAKMNSKGLIAISHSSQPAAYDYADGTSAVYEVESAYIITMLVNHKTDRSELFSLFKRIRNALFGLELADTRHKLLRHRISPQKFPDIQEGVWLAEIEILTVRLYYKEVE
jgi:hypothetical protein